MENKEKIKLLSDIQGAIDNEELHELIQQMPSGDFILKKFQASLQEELESILSGKSSKAAERKAEDIVKTLDKLEKSMVLEILKAMYSKLEDSSPAPAPKEPTTAAQEELRRQWEEQQKNLDTPRRRGESTGIY